MVATVAVLLLTSLASGVFKLARREQVRALAVPAARGRLVVDDVFLRP